MDSDVTEDAWGMTLTINGQVVYESSDFSFQAPPQQVQSLINYLTTLSPLKINLYSFS